MKFNPTANLFCSVYGHNYIKLNTHTDITPKLICKNCKKHFSYNLNGEVLETNNAHKERRVVLEII